MMVPRMQADILDAVISSCPSACHVVDPFVGSGTTLTEAILRGVDFTGIDINPLAALVCEAKIALARGVDLSGAVESLRAKIGSDKGQSIDIDFPNRSKWFSRGAAQQLSKLRRCILEVADADVRKVLWVVFAETIRLSSNSRTTTYKLHKRAEGVEIGGRQVLGQFESSLTDTCTRVDQFRSLARPASMKAAVICGDVRTAKVPRIQDKVVVVVTSPPYGDNVTTIPYGQFSYLALRCIPHHELPKGAAQTHLTNTHALDTASLGGSKKNTHEKAHIVSFASNSFEQFAERCVREDRALALKKVASFTYDFFEGLAQVHKIHSSSRRPAYWAITTGNRTVAGIPVPLDAMCGELAAYFGGTVIAELHRRLPTKRMPLRNTIGELISTETTTVVEFA
jgi:hypothetical protein